MAGADGTNSPLELESVAYMVGGIDTAGRILADVYGIGVTAGLEYGLWTSLTPLPGARAGAAAVLAFGKLVVIGGFGPDSLASRAVTSAAVNPDGTLNGWFNGPPLPQGLAFPAAALAGETLYVVGGERDVVNPTGVPDSTNLTGSVFAIRLSPLTGAFADSTWTELPVTLGHPRSRAAAFVVDDAVVVAGGIYVGAPSAGDAEYATLSSDGSLSTFQDVPGPTLADVVGNSVWSFAAATLWDAQGIARATVVGGLTPAGPSARIWSQ
jgi:hypothetical protein